MRNSKIYLATAGGISLLIIWALSLIIRRSPSWTITATSYPNVGS